LENMKIVADENIPYVKEVFTSLGQVHCVSGRSLNRALLRDADVLLVRSTTLVDANLLEETNVRFVGTATIGTDHINEDYLQSREIAFTSAAGSNANSVAEYVIAALLVLAQQKRWDLSGKTLGIVGVGNIGSRVENMAPALGLNVLANDPPRQRQTGDPRFIELNKVLEADFITLHVPLTRTGPDPTYHLFDEAILQQLSPQTVLINTSRGAVVDNLALNAQLANNALGPAVLDVWEDEPDINLDLLERVAIATPHIAGYSLDGKANGAAMLYERLCRFLDINPNIQIQNLLPPPIAPELTLDSEQTDQQILTRAMTTIYDILRDDRDLRRIANQPPDQRGKFFDRLRKDYPIRREARNTHVTLTQPNPPLTEKLNRLGFHL
jgi:erythronate-4-phosphate dehydrogenase